MTKRISGEIIIRVHGLPEEEFSPNTHEGVRNWDMLVRRISQPMPYVFPARRTFEELTISNRLTWEVLETDEDGETYWALRMGTYRDGELVLVPYDDVIADEEEQD